MTIEERAMLANPYKKEHYDSPYEINIEDKYAEGYIDGATEQQKIDIDKAIKFMVKLGLFGCEDSRYAEQFRKAMEEK